MEISVSKELTRDVLAKLGTAWPKKELTKDEANLWHEQLGHLDRDVAMKATSMVISECEWYPTIAKFLECARSIMRAQEASLAQAPPPLTETARKIQQQALAVQRDISLRRSMLLSSGDNQMIDKDVQAMAVGHRHVDGWLTCPICVQAHNEQDDADSCAVCMLLEDHGLHPSHHKG